MGALFKNNRREKTLNNTFFDVARRLFAVFVRFGPFLTSRRPGKASKSFLEVVRFIWTGPEPLGAHGDSAWLHLHDVPYYFRSAEDLLGDDGP